MRAAHKGDSGVRRAMSISNGLGQCRLPVNYIVFACRSCIGREAE